MSFIAAADWEQRTEMEEAEEEKGPGAVAVVDAEAPPYGVIPTSRTSRGTRGERYCHPRRSKQAVTKGSGRRRALRPCRGGIVGRPIGGLD